MSESINDASLGGVVGRHLHFHPVPDCKANETFAHLSRNVRENEMLVRKRDAKHGPREHGHDRPLQFDGFVRVHDVDLGELAKQSISNLPMIAREGTLRAVRTRTLFARTRFVNS